jgi:hypothetical protein
MRRLQARFERRAAAYAETYANWLNLVKQQEVVNATYEFAAKRRAAGIRELKRAAKGLRSAKEGLRAAKAAVQRERQASKLNIRRNVKRSTGNPRQSHVPEGMSA